jgi:hypothetical protein
MTFDIRLGFKDIRHLTLDIGLDFKDNRDNFK